MEDFNDFNEMIEFEQAKLIIEERAMDIKILTAEQIDEFYRLMVEVDKMLENASNCDLS